MEAMFYEKKKGILQCNLCPHTCFISDGSKGICRTRKNIDGKLVSLVYGKPAAVNVDPIEKKPLLHFLPGTNSFSIGTMGCNLTCEHCQNFDISCRDPEEAKTAELSPAQVVQMALEHDCRSISYTYNEPAVFYEYALETAKLARQKGLKNVLVTNGFINHEPAKKWLPFMDAANVDLKSFDEKFYREICGGSLQPVLDTIKLYKKHLWLEVTNLVIYKKNDDMHMIEEMVKWLSSLGQVPLHFSRAFPMFKMQDIAPTPMETLVSAKKIADNYLDHVYIGNAAANVDTNCPKFGAVLIERTGYDVGRVLEKCGCGYELVGVFK